MRRFNTMAIFAFLSAALALSLGSAHAGISGTLAPNPPEGFVGVRGTQFFLDSHLFRVAGVNNHYLSYASEAEVTRVLDDAVAMHANVVRTFLGPVIGSPDGSTPTIWNWKSTSDSSNLGVHGRYMLSWDAAKGGMVINDGPDGLQRLDFLLAEAKRRHLKLIISLLDFWGYTGGAQQISAWYGSHEKYTFFARDPRCRQDYRNWIEHVIRQFNSITHEAYRDDPTIFAWELMNEPDIQPRELLLDWVREMSALVKSIDPNHLVATGHGNMVNKLADLAIPTVDFGTWHGYADYEKMSVGDFRTLIGSFCEIAKRENKPVILEEFGLAGTDAGKLDAYRNWIAGIRNNQDCAGWLVWRLVSRQDDGSYPSDHDQFDIRNDGCPLWRGMQALADQTRNAPIGKER
jgi:mannan endo-1,4-beta-mannosidase